MAGVRLPLDTLRPLRYLLQNTNWPPYRIAQDLKISRKTVYRRQLCWDLFGEPYPPQGVVIGRPRILTREAEERLMLYLEDRPTAYLDEMLWYLWDDLGVWCDLSTIWRTLERCSWSRKVAKKRAAAQSERLRALFKAKSMTWLGDKIVCVDETGSNARTGDRKHGWSPTGMPLRAVHQLRRDKRWSVLPAITTKGWLCDPLMHQGSINAEMFIEWLENHVLSKLTGGGWILVLDNASTHREVDVARLCQQYGVQLEFLPPYSPDLNPIEQAFHVLKMWLRRHCQLLDRFPSFQSFLRYGVEEVGGAWAREHFIKSGYNCGQWEQEQARGELEFEPQA